MHINDEKHIGFRLNGEQLARVEKVKPITKKLSPFMFEMALVGLDYTISKAGSQNDTDSKIIKEINRLSTTLETAINDLRNSIKDISERQDAMVNVISSNVENIIRNLRVNAAKEANNETQGIKEKEPSEEEVKKLREDVEGIKNMFLRLANDDRIKGLNVDEINLLRGK